MVAERGAPTKTRDSLAATPPSFDEVSPHVGQLDQVAFSAALQKSPDAAVALLADLASATDPKLRRQARHLAGRLLPPLGRVGEPRRRGTRRMAPRVGMLEGDVDIDRTLERSLGARPVSPRDIVTRQFAAAPRSVCLLVDRSGSMGGHAVALAAVAAAAVVSARGARLRCSVVAFASEPLILLDAESHRPATAVVDDLLSLRGHGTTNLARALQTAALQLRSVPPGGRTAVLLSDAVHTAGPDPLPSARALDRLDVLGTSDDPEAIAAGKALARGGQGRWLPATTLAELADSLRRALA
jgi:Mg-chelatase subunit ChlD